MLVIWSAIFLLVIAVSLWDLFEKAGERGWKALVPIYNTFVLAKIAGRPGWLALFIYVPYILQYFEVSVATMATASVLAGATYLIIALDLAKVFGKSVMFGIFGLFFFSFFGFVALGWGDATYHKPAQAKS